MYLSMYRLSLCSQAVSSISEVAMCNIICTWMCRLVGMVCRAWDTLFYSQTEGSLVANIPHFFNISLCGPLLNSACGNSSSVCYSSSLEESSFYNLGTNQSRQVTYGDRRVTFTYTFSLDEKVMKRYGTGNVSITLICGRTLVGLIVILSCFSW